MYLIDGHNLIGSGALPAIELSQPDDEQRLVAYLRGRRPALGQDMTVVFDSGVPGGFSLELSGGGVNAVFAAQGRGDADSLVLGRVRRSTKPGQVTVVSNDAALLAEVRALGAATLTVAAFLQRLQKAPRLRSPRGGRPRPEPKLPKAEVDEWLSVFGEGDDETGMKRR